MKRDEKILFHQQRGFNTHLTTSLTSHSDFGLLLFRGRRSIWWICNFIFRGRGTIWRHCIDFGLLLFLVAGAVLGKVALSLSQEWQKAGAQCNFPSFDNIYSISKHESRRVQMTPRSTLGQNPRKYAPKVEQRVGSRLPPPKVTNKNAILHKCLVGGRWFFVKVKLLSWNSGVLPSLKPTACPWR